MTQTNRETRSTDAGLRIEESQVDLATRCDFLELTEDDAHRLRELLPRFRSSSRSFVDVFYRHLQSFEETARFLKDPVLVERLKELQLAHFESLLKADWNEEFSQRRKRIGQIHAERGIQALFFLGPYCQFIDHLIHNQTSGQHDKDACTPDDLLSLFKAVFLDVSLTLESYFMKLNQDLRQALDIVWRANNELRQFARLASHDLKTPLATVANLCEEALDEFGDRMPSEASELIEAARQSVFRMSHTIDELLSATISSESGGGAEEVSLERVLREAIDRIQPGLEKKGIEVTIPKGLPHIIGNGIQLREVFYNLLSNAEKYIDKTPGRISIEAETRDGDCVLSIADNGPGIPPNELEQIFVPFRRLPLHRNRPGSGLGLYFAKVLVEQQGGRIWAESELDKGSCFFVQLPTKTDPASLRDCG